jgi:uncharacterized protein YodC (DUF2158 family)
MGFEAGDVVQLKSGGQTMTIEEVSAGRVACIWFDDKNKVCRDAFSAVVLEKYEPFSFA